ncbi:MAG: hypothetical protein QOI61_2173 [Actinomycetota bacterium]|jgi:hypothetical protein
MRRLLVFMVGLVVAIASATPVGALGPAGPRFAFLLDPVAGVKGTSVTARGTCPSSGHGTVTLRPPIRSDAIFMTSVGDFDTDAFGNFTANFTTEQPYFNGDIEVVISCPDPAAGGHSYEVQPFTITTETTNNPSRIFTGFGPGVCGYGSFGPLPPLTCEPHVKGFDSAGRMNSTNFYVEDWRGGVNVAAGKVGSGTALLVGSRPQTMSRAQLVNLRGERLLQLQPFGSFEGEINVALGDLDGDGSDELVFGAGGGGGPHVKAYSFVGGALKELVSFFAYDPTFNGGVNVATADTDGDGKAEIVTGAGPGGGPHVRTFTAQGAPIGDGFFAYAPGFRGGVFVAGGDLDEGGAAEIVTGAGAGGGPHVRTFTPDGSPIGNGFFAYDPQFTQGVRVAAGNADAASGNEIVTGTGTGASHVRVFNAAGVASGPGFYAYSTSADSGVAVAVLR